MKKIENTEFSYVITDVMEFSDFAELGGLGGCSDYGDNYGLNSFHVDFYVLVSDGNNNKTKFHIIYQSEERTNDLMYYAGWEMSTNPTVDDDAYRLEVFLDYETDQIFGELESKAEALAKRHFELLLDVLESDQLDD